MLSILTSDWYIRSGLVTVVMMSTPDLISQKGELF